MIELAIRPPGRHSRQPYDPEVVEIQVDLQSFLAGLTAFPSLTRLGHLDFYDRTRIDQEWRDAIIGEISHLLCSIEQKSIKLDVPDKVGLVSDEDSQRDFGLGGFSSWLMAVRGLAERARSLDIPLWALGN